jgi:hypothetical protein
MSRTLWAFERSIECGAPREFAWKYWTNPANWYDPPARFEFDGPFAVGTRLTTVLPGQLLESVIREIVDGREALIEMEAMSATVQFRWRFKELPSERTSITQVISLFAEGGSELVEQASVLEQSVPEGMARPAENIARKWLENKL